MTHPPPPLRRRPTHRALLAASGVLLAMIACRAEPAAPSPDGPWTPAELALIGSLSPVPPLPPSPTNRVADSPEAAELGQRLFFDTRLSRNGKVACATCHIPSRAFTDGKQLAEGVGTAGRHAPTIIGAQWNTFQFWDGRKDSLWAQSLGPFEADVEHGISRVRLARLVAEHHEARYEALFGPLPDGLSDEVRFPDDARPVPYEPEHPHSRRWAQMLEGDRLAINTVVANVGKAIEAYERKLVPGTSPFDRYVAALASGDASGGGHLSPDARRGLRVFVGQGQCINCHNGPLLTDGEFHNLGLPFDPASKIDQGRTLGAKAVLKDEFRCGSPYSEVPPERCDHLNFLNPEFVDFEGAFKTPTLRNVALTAPYMHDGQFATLQEVLGFYKTLPGQARIGHRELVLELLQGDISSDDLIAFLQALTGDLPDERWMHPPPETP